MRTPDERSPYGLMQEDFRNEPWKLLVCCILLNLSSRKVAEPIWNRLFERWPVWTTFLADVRQRQSSREELLSLLNGFQNRRCERIIRMTEGIEKQFRTMCRDRMMIEPLELYGIGKYGSDSYRIFIKRELVEDVKDKELVRYVEWAKERQRPRDEAANA